MGPHREKTPPKIEPHAKDTCLRHVVDMIIGGEIPHPEVVLLETSSPYFRWIYSIITFTDEEYLEGIRCTWGPLTVQLNIYQDVKKVLIDNGSFADIIFSHALRERILDEQKIQFNANDVHTSLYGFGNNTVPIQGLLTCQLPLVLHHKRLFPLLDTILLTSHPCTMSSLDDPRCSCYEP